MASPADSSFVNAQTFQLWLLHDPEVTDGTGINFTFGFIAEGSKKRPVILRGFRRRH